MFLPLKFVNLIKLELTGEKNNPNCQMVPVVKQKRIFTRPQNIIKTHFCGYTQGGHYRPTSVIPGLAAANKKAFSSKIK